MGWDAGTLSQSGHFNFYQLGLLIPGNAGHTPVSHCLGKQAFLYLPSCMVTEIPPWWAVLLVSHRVKAAVSTFTLPP